MQLTASAPGSLMVSGEHAVVYGAPAIVCAIAARVRIHLRSRTDRRILIHSALADHATDLDTLADHPKLRFILAALRQAPPVCGLELDIVSNIDPTLGLGSSAAVTATLIALLARLRGEAFDPAALHRAAHRTILAVQKRGSGADLAASLAGGMVAYTPATDTAPACISALPLPPTGLSLRYAGYKTPTAEVLAHIAARTAADPPRFQEIYTHMGENCAATITAIERGDWPDAYRLLNGYQTLMAALGVCDAVQAVHLAAAYPYAHAVKISGSGLGDCILAFADTPPPQHQAVAIDGDGLRFEA